jgi:formylglycine-generating enzyme required for sulfatase activity
MESAMEDVRKILTSAQLAVGDPIENSIGMVLVPIPTGEFMMGSPETEKYRQGLGTWEKQHPVTLTKPFYLGATEVTQAQWKAVMGTTPWKFLFFSKRGVEEGDHYPATYVGWEDAVEFCRKLSEKEGVEYRLPTEAEWEYACRAGTTTVYSFGDNESQLGEYAWYKENTRENGIHHALIVGKKKPNPWGLYDMHGNVWEWCQDLYGKYPDATDPQGPSEGSIRVIRGGSWWYNSDFCRSAERSGDTPDSRYNGLGFRVLRSSVK